MATATIYSSTADGYLECDDSASDYAAARAGTGNVGVFLDDTSTTLAFGQGFDGSTTYYVLEAFLSFDLFAAGLTGATVTAATLSLWFDSVLANIGNYTLQVRSYNWAAPLATNQFLDGGSLSGQTLLATLSTSGLSTGAYGSFVENGTALRSAVAAALAGDGVLRLLLCSSETVANTTPVIDHYVIASTADPGTLGSPKLVLTYTPAFLPAPTRPVLQAVQRASSY